jgi:hypothetical protein
MIQEEKKNKTNQIINHLVKKRVKFRYIILYIYKQSLNKI